MRLAFSIETCFTPNCGSTFFPVFKPGLFVFFLTDVYLLSSFTLSAFYKILPGCPRYIIYSCFKLGVLLCFPACTTCYMLI